MLGCIFVMFIIKPNREELAHSISESFCFLVCESIKLNIPEEKPGDHKICASL